MRPGSVFLVLLLSLPIPGAALAEVDAGRTVGDLGKVGTVAFSTSCDPALQTEFDRGVALLHSFFFAEARRVFEGILTRDPECAMAYWGVAQSHYHMLWTPPDSAELAAGRTAIGRAKTAKKKDAREEAYIVAAAAYFEHESVTPLAGLPATGGAPSCHGDPAAGAGHRERAACYLREIEKVSKAYPDDVDAAAFHALSLLGNAPTGDGTLSMQARAASILEPWYEQKPQHPGLVHYLIHSYDYPSTASRGLDAALAYADIAPWVPHALHMPSHIFTRLGMWEETIASNLASAAAGRRLAPAENIGYFEELHALDYLMYGYLQTGQDGKAQGIVERVASFKGTMPDVDAAAAFAFGAIPARYTLERRDWQAAAGLNAPPMPFWKALPFSKAHIVYANAVGAAKSGDIAKARAAAAELGMLSQSMTDPRFAYFRFLVSIQQRAAHGLIEIAEGRMEAGLDQLAAAAASEDSIGKSPVSPGAILPIRELYAEALLEAGRAEEALAQYEASLQIYPNRLNGLYGAALAADRSGESRAAEDYYMKVLDLAANGDGVRAEVVAAKKRLRKS